MVVADNGSTDGSIEIAEKLGARVIPVAQRGYGSALKAGIRAARGAFIIMGDADDSYDFGEVPRFVEEWRKGNEVVMGNRFRRRDQARSDALAPQVHRQSGFDRRC